MNRLVVSSCASNISPPGKAKYKSSAAFSVPQGVDKSTLRGDEHGDANEGTGDAMSNASWRLSFSLGTSQRVKDKHNSGRIICPMMIASLSPVKSHSLEIR